MAPQAFVELSEFVNCAVTAEEKAAMTYDVLTSEHIARFKVGACW